MSQPKDTELGSRSSSPRSIAGGLLWSDERYELSELLGEGGSGRVYRAFDRVLGHEVALKTLKNVSADDAYRLKKEFRTLVDVSHPHVIRLYDLVASPDRCFFTMELVGGPDFLTWMWKKGQPDPKSPLPPEFLERLRLGAIQLAEGVNALHELGKLHRDIKPSNILVGPDDRVVVVDVGLVSQLESHQSMMSRMGRLVGTLQYMAPEQLWGRELSTAADWYSVGVVLYEALTGLLPYESVRTLARRVEEDTEPLFPSGTPREWVDLITDLLRPTPAKRPAFADILRRLGGTPSVSLVVPHKRAAFQGRKSELEWIGRRYEAAQRGSAAFLHITGEPGVGKTALMEAFLSQIENAPSTVVLRGRCHYREYVSFRALDGLVDNLSRYLSRLDVSELADILPADAVALLQVFPVLRRVGALEQVDSTTFAAHDYRLRHRAFVVLRELLRRIAETRDLVVWVDDLQWADRESAVFFRSLECAAPFGRLMCVFTSRPLEQPESHVAVLFAPAPHGTAPARLDLERLDPESTRDLVAAVSPEATREQSDAIIAGSAGVPLLVQALCAELAGPDAAQRGAELPTFEQLVVRRVGLLAPSAKQVLQAICIAGYAVEHRLLSTITSPAEAEDAVARLREAGLIRQVIEGGRIRLEPTHHRVREAVVGRLSPAERAELHHGLASALRSMPDAHPQDLLEHLFAGGQTDHAVEEAIAAAELADHRAAFEMSAKLYQRVLDIGLPVERQWRVRAALGKALIHGGHAEKGAAELVRAAEILAQLAPRDPRVVRLKSDAGERLLLGGFIDDGSRLMGEALQAVGTPFPRNAGVSLLRGAMLMPRSSLAKKRWETRRKRGEDASGAMPDEDALRLDVVWSAGFAIAWLDPMRAIELGVRHAVLAYAAGDPGHIARSLAVDAIIAAMTGGEARWTKAIAAQQSAQRLADASGDPDVQAFVAVYAGMMHYFMGQWRNAQRFCEQAIQLCYGKEIRAIPALFFAEWACLTCLMYAGEVSEMRSRMPDSLMAVEARNEPREIASFRLGWINFAHLCADQPEVAAAEAEAAFQRFEKTPFTSVHYLHLTARANTCLYQGDADAAWRHVASHWPGLVASHQLRMTTVHSEMFDVRGRVALARALASTDAETRRQMVREATSAWKALEKSSLPAARALGTVIRAGVAGIEQRTRESIDLLESAALEFDRLQMSMHVASCRLRLASLLSGSRAADLAQKADDWFAAPAIRRPEQVTSVIVPYGTGDRA
jgi:hypothetical protein